MNRKRMVMALVAALALCLITAGAVLAMSSANYNLFWKVFSGGGGGRSSTNYRLGDTAGQSATGVSQSPGYRLESGFWSSDVGEATITVTVKLQGDYRPAEGYGVLLTFKLYDQEVTTTNITSLTPVPGGEFTSDSGKITITGTDVPNKLITFTVSGLPVANDYYATLYTPHCLVNYKSGINIAPSGTTIDMGELLEGDAKDIADAGGASKTIDSTDFQRFALAYEAIPTSGNWNVLADFDRNNLVEINDFSLLYTNYGKSSPQPVP